MTNSSRLDKSFRNVFYGITSQIIILLLNFLVRTFFIRYLDIVYLGVNGLFTNILTVLSLAELGFGNAMVYSMYKPLASGNKKTLQALMKLYARVYLIVALVVAFLGLSAIPFMDYIILDKPDIEHLYLIYLIYLGNSVLSYLFSYKRSVLDADQKSYINYRYRNIFAVVKAILQIGSLIIFKNFILFLLIQVLATMAENIYVTRQTEKIYPFLKGGNTERLAVEEYIRIKENVKALVLSKIGGVALNGTDNIIISAMVGIIWVGLLSNYVLITGSLEMIISQITAGIKGSVGNYIASEKIEKQYNLFRKIDFMHYWLYGFSSICLFILFNPFITLWIGEKYTLNTVTVAIISINYFIQGMLSSFWTFRTTMGLFIQGRFRPIIAAIINIVVSVILAQYLGLLGVLLGTTITRLMVNAWYDPYVIFKHGFDMGAGGYYINYLKRFLLLVTITAILFLMSQYILDSHVTNVRFILLVMLSAAIPNIAFYLAYHKSEEFKYFLGLAKQSAKRIRIQNDS